MKNICILLSVFFAIQFTNAQKELPKIKQTLNDYMEGTANGEPARVKKAFHKDLNLYHIKNGELAVWKGTNYTNNIKEGKKSNRIGRIVSIDQEGNAAMAKIEIKMPNLKRIYTDYLMLLKIGEEWKIIHKSFSYKTESE